MKDNLKIAQINEDFVQNQLKKANINKLKDCVIATIDNSGKMYIQPKDKQYQTLTVDYKGGGNW